MAHRQVFRRRRASEVSGRIAGASIGMGYGWWQDKHTRHHADPTGPYAFTSPQHRVSALHATLSRKMRTTMHSR